MDLPLTPYPYQEDDIQKIVANNGTGIVATQVGGGKTLTAIEVGKRLGTRTNLVIAPKGTHKRAWEKTILRQIPTASVRYINSTKEGILAFNDLRENKVGWFLISPEYFRKIAWSGVHVDYAVFDEVHRASNRRSRTAAMLHTLKADHRVGMSGTIAGNKIEGFWSVIRWVYPTVAGRSFWKWVDQYCTTKFDPFAGKIVSGEIVAGKIVESLPCYIRHLKRDECCSFHPNGMDAELPRVQVLERTVELSSEQKRIYKKMEKDLVVWLGEHPMVAEVPIATRIRLRQITLGVPTVDSEGVVSFDPDCKSSKIDEMFSIISDLPEGEPLLILTHSQKFAEVVTARLNKHNISAFEWSGTASQDSRNKALESFIKGDLQAIVAVISAIGEGTDGLQLVCSTVIWLSKDDNRLMNEQASGRLDRNGQTKSVLSYEILAENTYDEGQLSKLVSDQITMNESLRKGN